MYTAKQFFFGKAADNNAAQVYDLKTDDAVTPPDAGDTKSANQASVAVDNESLTVDQIKAKLTGLGIEFDNKLDKADLLALLPKE